MKVLLYKDLISKFISNDIGDRGFHLQIKKIIENENTVFLFSKKFILFLKNEIANEFQDELNTFITKISDSGFNVTSLTTSTNFDQEYINIYQTTNDNVIFSISHDVPTPQITNSIPNHGVITSQIKPNYDWLAIQLAILHPNKVTVNCFDFSSDQEVTKFFEYIFKLPKVTTLINIFDTQCNLGHNKFDSIAKKKFVNYNTLFFVLYKYPTVNLENKAKIIAKFGSKSRMQTTQPKFAHGRRILFENFIVTCDNDFWNLEVDKQDWDIDVQYCALTCRKWLSKLDKYREYR